MRGIIFKAYCEFIREKLDPKSLDKLLTSENYPNKGGFSALGNYKTSYMVLLIDQSTKLFNSSKNEILRSFGRFTYSYLHKRFKKIYLDESEILNLDNPYDFLENLNTLHFSELKKLYPNANFPEFEIDRIGSEHIVLEYSSFRDLPYLTYGLIEGCLEFFKMKASVTMVKTEKLRTIDGKSYPVYSFEVKSNG